MRRLPSLTAAAFVLVTALAHADVWTWKDASGVAHYSDQPVEGAVRIKGTVPHGQSVSSGPAGPSAAPDSKAKLAALNEAAEATRTKSNAELAVQQDVAKKQEEQCTQAKNHYNDAISSRRIYKTGPDGDRQFMSDAEADEYRVKVRSDMDEACGKSDPAAVR
jgi:hypothetical protein